MNSPTATTTNTQHDAARQPPPLNRHQAFIASRLPAALKQPGSSCLKSLSTIPPTTPAWYSQAAAHLREAFDSSQLARCTSQHQLDTILGRLKPLDTFAAPLLRQAIRQASGLELDVGSTYFVRRMQNHRPSSMGGLFDFSAGDPKVRTWYWDVTLLEAALHNFTAGEAAKPPAEGDEFITHDHNTDQVQIAAYDKSSALPLAPERFAALCRTLDLGKRYQEHINAVLNPSDTTLKAQVRHVWSDHLHNQLAEAVHLARMKDQLAQDAYQALVHWLTGHSDIRLAGHRLRPWRLRMLGVDLGDILFLRAESGPSPRRCIVYIPGDDLQPVRDYDSSKDFMIDLRTRLHNAQYRRFFGQFIAVREQATFFSALKKRLDPTDRHEMWDDYSVDPNLLRHLELTELPLRVGATPLLKAVCKDQCEIKIGRLLADARALAVPTGDEDREARTARFLGFFEATLDLLNLLAFIPGVGQVVLLAMGTRMLHEVYSGIEAWEAGDTRQAWAHLLGVAMNVAFIGGAGVVLPHIDTSAFVDGLIPVSVRKGVSRLWKPDLAPYRHQPKLPARGQANELGLYDYLGDRYLLLEDHYYRLERDGPGRYHARHAQAGQLLNPHAPEFRSNGAGAWKHELDEPLGWADERLFSRLGPEASRLDANTARRIQHISGIEGDVLRATHHNGRQPPALLDDTLIRFTLDRDLGHLLQRLHNGGTSSGSLDELHMELQLLTSDPVWPRTKVLRLLNSSGRTIQEYPANIGPQVTRIEVNWPDLDADGLLRQVLENLDEGEARTLLREEFGQGPLSLSSRTTALRRRLASDGLARRGHLFESHYRYRSDTGPADPGTVVLQRDFPGLPTRLAQELARGADALERQRLRTGRIPLRLAEEARHYLRQVRLARQYESLYLDSVGQAEVYRIGLAMLEKLPGWSSRVRLEVRDRFFAGPLLDSLGHESAAIRKVLVRNAGQYEAYDADGLELHGPDDLYASVLHALPDAERAMLGFPAVNQGAQLKQALRALPPLPREELARRLSLPAVKPGFRSPMRLADGRIGYPMSGRRIGHGHVVRRMARKLYPSLSLTKVFALHGLEGLSLDETIARLETLQGEFQQLENELQAWVEEAQSAVPMAIRHSIGEQIKSCWRHETEISEGSTTGRELNLIYPGADLPKLSANFDHVIDMKLHIVPSPGQEPDLAGFLDAFPRLKWLDLSGSGLTRLPSSLARMSQLEELDLRNNDIVLSQDTPTVLAQLNHLRVLNLNGNAHLTQLPDLGTLPQLSFIYLRGAGLRQWPTGYEQLPQLRRLDLSSNLIDAIPAPVFALGESRRTLNLAIDLSDNPLPIDELRRVESYRRQTDVDLGLGPLVESADPSEWDEHSQPASRASSQTSRWGTPSPVPRDVSPWLEGSAETEQQVRHDTWLQLASDDIDASEAFFKVLADLRNSADFLHDNGIHRPQLRERVWRMIKAAHTDTRLRKKLFLKANRAVNSGGFLVEADTCEDGMTTIFDDMGQDVLLQEAMALPLEEREAALLQLARGKVRLAQVDRQARQEVEARKAGGTTPDEVEVHLAFRIGLADRLGLPWQARSMLYADVAQVSQPMLDEAYQAILAEEHRPGEQARSLLEQPFWEQYLNERFARTRLEPLLKQREERLEALEDLQAAQLEWFSGQPLSSERSTQLQQTIGQCATTLGLMQSQVFIGAMTSESYNARLEMIGKPYRDALEQLTDEALQRHGR